MQRSLAPGAVLAQTTWPDKPVHIVVAWPADGYTIGIMGMHAISQAFMNTNATALDKIDPLVYVSDEPGALQVAARTGVNMSPSCNKTPQS